MRYLDFINRFWQLDEQHGFSGDETRLYFYLLKVASERKYPDEFVYSDGRLAVAVRCQRPKFLLARERLRVAGLLDFKGGHNPSDDALYTLFTDPKHQLSVFGECQVYLMQDLDGLCKIGSSGDPQARLRQIHNQLGTKALRLIVSFPGGRIDERRIQAHYQKKHVWGEWYNLTPFDIMVFQRLARMKNR